MAAVDELPRESWQVPPSTLRPRERAGILLGLIETHGWILEFVHMPDVTDTRMHVLGPDDDQPRYATAAENLALSRMRTVCGLVIYSSMSRSVAPAHPFPDDRLCASCHRAFQAHGVEAPSVIFEHNTQWFMDASYGANGSARRALEYEDREREAAGKPAGEAAGDG
jgi:hypothetical protein